METFPPELRVVARAVLPADTKAEGPVSGARLKEGPFWGQPVQGFSGLVALPDGGLLGLTDNGYGVAENSGDFLLRVYSLEPDFDGGRLGTHLAFTLSDPSHQLPWPITRHFTPERWLTGADLDPESFVRAPDGTFWFGDEQGPFLVHTDEHGQVLEPPFSVEFEGEVLRSPDDPHLRINLMLRSLEALRVHAQAHDAGTPVASPDHRWLETAAQVKQLHAAGFRVIPWTVNEPSRMSELIDAGVDGLISDVPDLLAPYRGLLDVQGHRGARGLAPENTLAAFRAGLDAGVSTLELDLTATADDEPAVSHDARIGPPRCHHLPDAGLELPRTSWKALRGVTCDGLLPQFPRQKAGGDTHVLTLGEVAALGAPMNVETKVHGTGAEHDDPLSLTRWLGRQTALRGRMTLQSFDWRSLTTAHEEFPWLQTVALFGGQKTDESRAGLPWPQVDAKPNLARSGGFENLAITPDGKTLYAMLEKPRNGSRECLAFAFDLTSRRLTGLAFRYPLHERATAVGDFTLVDATHGYALERDDSEGKLDGFKRLVAFTLPATPGGLVEKGQSTNLLDLTWAGAPFTFPFWTPEGVAVTPRGIFVINDNNYPFGRGRSANAPDPTELIVLQPGAR